MAKSEQFELIIRRREQLDRERAELLERIQDLKRREVALDQEAHELTVTERTLARLNDVALPNEPDEPPARSGRKGKPMRTPTVLDMALTILAEAEQQNLPSLDVQEIIKEIRVRWWPNAKSNDIAPTLWRAAKEGRIVKDGTRYGRLTPSESTP